MAQKGHFPVRLVLVSKLKPASDILALHQSSSRSEHFGENYVQELTEKAHSLPRSIKWHFIGALQSNKCKALAEGIPNLWCVSSVDSVKKADLLEKGRAALTNSPKENTFDGDGDKPDSLRIKVQINTSGESSKSGVTPGTEAVDLCRHIVEQCPHLKLSGMMTIGAIARSKDSENVNEDFTVLAETRDNVAKELGLEKEALELSMGMSADFATAIQFGATHVRVGSAIFGRR